MATVMCLLVVAALLGVCHGVPPQPAAPAAPDTRHAVVVEAESCTAVTGFFSARNLSSPVPGSPVNGLELQECRSARTCCTPGMEAELQLQVHRDFTALVHHNSQSTQGLLVSSAASLREHLVRLAHWSEGKTLTLFSQVYQRMAVLAQGPIRQLYADIVRYLDAPASPPQGDVAWLSSPPQGLSMTDTVNRFFAKLFPLTFHHTTLAPLRKSGGQLEPAYERCLSSKMAEVQPFGESSRVMAHSLGRALEAARVLLGVLRIGADILNTTDSLLIDSNDLSGSPCPALLLRLWTCPRCAGLGDSVRPCQSYCRNVLRGCVSARASELEQPWAEFAEAAAKLAVSVGHSPPHPGRPQPAAGAAPYLLNAEEAIRQIEHKISEAIMFAMENGPAVERKMKSACGPPKYLEGGEGARRGGARPQQALQALPVVRPFGPPPSLASHESAAHFARTLRDLQDSLLRSRSFYVNLADVLCDDDGFATKDGEDCWNGERVAEYTKTVVAPSASAQRYNPELPRGPGGAGGSTSLAQLSDQLRHLQQLVASQVGELGVPAAAPESDSYVRDEEGSGDGGDGRWREPPFDDEDHPAWGEGSGQGGLGSGDGGIHTDIHESRTPDWKAKSEDELHITHTSGEENGEKTSAASPLRQSSESVIVWVSVLTVLRLVWR